MPRLLITTMARSVSHQPPTPTHQCADGYFAAAHLLFDTMRGGGGGLAAAGVVSSGDAAWWEQRMEHRVPPTHGYDPCIPHICTPHTCTPHTSTPHTRRTNASAARRCGTCCSTTRTRLSWTTEAGTRTHARTRDKRACSISPLL